MISCQIFQCIKAFGLTEKEEIAKLKDEYKRLLPYKDLSEHWWGVVEKNVEKCCGKTKKEITLIQFRPVIPRFKEEALIGFLNQTKFGDIKSVEVVRLLMQSVNALENFETSYKLIKKAAELNEKLQ